MDFIKIDSELNKEKIEVLYQDSLNNIFKVKPVVFNNKSNEHLERFERLPKKLSKYCFVYWIYKIKIKISIVQKNSYLARFECERKLKEKEEINKYIKKD